MNDDGHGRRVFDGVLTHVAGAGKTFANHSFAMPGRTATQHEDRLYPENWFPFGNAVTTDPFSGQPARCCKARPTDPLMIEVNTSTEYWQKGASLVHTDPAGRAGRRTAARCPRLHDRRDAAWRRSRHRSAAPAPASTRATRTAPARRCARCSSRSKNGSRDGVAPPDSRVPRIADGTAGRGRERRDAGGARFRRAAGRQPHRRAGRLGRPAGPARQFLRRARLRGRCRRQRDRRHPPAADRGAARHLYRLERLPGPALRIMRPRRIADPVRPDPSASARPPATRAPRSKSATAAATAYVAKVRQAAAALVAERLLLPSDAEAYVRAAESCDRF